MAIRDRITDSQVYQATVAIRDRINQLQAYLVKQIRCSKGGILLGRETGAGPAQEIDIGSGLTLVDGVLNATLQAETTGTILTKLGGAVPAANKIGAEYLPSIQTRTSSAGPPVSGSFATGASAVMVVGSLTAYDIFTIGSDTFQFVDLVGDVEPGYYPIVFDAEDPGTTHINVVTAINLVSVEVNATYRSEDGEIDLHANNLGTAGNTVGVNGYTFDVTFLFSDMGTTHLDGGIDDAVTGTPVDVLGRLCRVGPYSIIGERTEAYDWYIAESILPAVWRQLDEAVAGGAPSEHASNHAAGGTDPICYHSDTAPTTAEPGQKWLQTSTGREYEYFGGAWVEVASGPALDLSGYLTTEDAGTPYNLILTSDVSALSTAYVDSSETITLPEGTYEFTAAIYGITASATGGIDCNVKLSANNDSDIVGQIIKSTNISVTGGTVTPVTTMRTGSAVLQHLFATHADATNKACCLMSSGMFTLSAFTTFTPQVKQRSATDGSNAAKLLKKSSIKFIKR